MKAIFPMAGFGSRFSQLADKNPEYKPPKPFINVLGKPMIVWAVNSLPFIKPQDLIFIVLQQHQDSYQVKDQLIKLFSPKIKVILIPHTTRGAAETALAAKPSLDPNEDIIIADSDQYLDSRNLYQAILHKTADTCGIIPVDRPIDSQIKHSYTLADANNLAIKVAEKDPVLAAQGAYSNIGAYYFTKAKIFTQAIESIIKANAVSGPPDRQEFYVAPIYQYLIEHHQPVYIAPSPNAWRLGTPEDLEYFNTHFKP